MEFRKNMYSTLSVLRALRASAVKLMFLSVALTLAGCASTGSTFGSGVGDRFLDEPPYYAGRQVTAASVAHLPIYYQQGAGQAPIFEPSGDEGSAVASLLHDMNAYLDSLGVSVRLDVPEARAHTPPDVRFSCQTDATGDCEADGDDITVQGRPWMLLAVGRPSSAWTQAVAAALAQAGREHVLVITLEIGQYWTHQRNLVGSKEVRLGTGYTQDVPWLTSLDDPVQVLQLTGALVGADGKAVRIGAEGLLARPTNIVAGGFGGQALIRAEDVERLRELRRDGSLVWQVALRSLVRELTGR